MLSRDVIERILIANGVDPTGPDEEIKEVLIRARWIDDDVETALSVLRENENHEVREDTVNQVFHSDTKLDAAAASQLLGVTLDASVFTPDKTKRNYRSGMSVKQFFLVLTIGTVITFMLCLAAYLHITSVAAAAV